MCMEYCVLVNMYHVSAQDIDECIINVCECMCMHTCMRGHVCVCMCVCVFCCCCFFAAFCFVLFFA